IGRRRVRPMDVSSVHRRRPRPPAPFARPEADRRPDAPCNPNPRVGGRAPPRSRMMSPDLDYRPDPNDLEDAEFEMAVRALRRRRLITLTVLWGTLVALLTVPWTRSIDASGRVAPARWAK